MPPSAELRATTRHANKDEILRRLHSRNHHWGTFYIGFTEDLQTRLKTHNAGNVPHTAKHRPWQIKTAIAFTNREKALEFERYLKSSSGRARGRYSFQSPLYGSTEMFLKF